MNIKLYKNTRKFTNNKIIINSEASNGTVKPVIKRPLSKRPQIGFQDKLSLNAGQKYCRRGAFCNTFDLR